MNQQRSQAYSRVVKTIEDLASSKLHADEQQVVREAADALFFCEDMGNDPGAEKALADLYELADRLVESDRVARETADRLIADVEACGPFAAVS